MATFWNRWIGRPNSSRSTGRKRKNLRRRMRPENLESRQLLAANLFHNELMPEDVNEDGIVSALDALTIINEMSRQTAEGRTAGAGDAQTGGNQPGSGRMTDVNNDGRHTALDALMVINRISRDRGRVDPPTNPTDPQSPTDDVPTDDTPTDETLTETEVRSIDGTGNNIDNPELGSTDTELLRVAENDYADGISLPAGEDRPSAREISNTLSAADPNGTTSERNLTSFVFAWGQFLDHDIDLSLEPSSEEDAISFDIDVPTGDALFDPFSTGEETIHLTRSAVADGSGTSTDNPAEQVNSISAWIDGSQVYGSDQETSDSLREFVGGRLLITEDGLLPTDENGGVLAGDIRAAENVVLTSMHALFVREHNRLADEIEAANPDLTDEEIFQEARATVIAELQSITINEYLPALLGEGALSDYEGYDSSVDPSIANEFSTAAFRFGHTTLNDEFRFVGNNGEDLAEPIALADAFFQPELLEATGIDSLLKYASSTLSQEIDLEVVDGLRNFLFGPPGAGGLDLVSLNIQRGRDHGLADYNATREAYGLTPVESFDQISSDPAIQANLESLYGDVNNIDLWIGLLAEDHTDNGSLGETATAIIADQFERLRDGDRFWYENVFTESEVRDIESTSLADIIERNTNVDSLQENVFFFSPRVTGSVASDGSTTQSRSGEQISSARNDLGTIDEVDLELLAIDQARNVPGNTVDVAGRGDRSPGPADNQVGPIRQPVDQIRAIEGVTVELLDLDGNVVDTAITDARGSYAFDSFDQSGAYTIRIAETEGMTTVGSDTFDVAIATGSERISGLNFRVVV
ncbi:Serine-aspartate repeat-containing protein I precursor [Rubripirellula tenax]|uniref:Serine-aspartate repeat-containing protein I n=1 Tax=Rubripirellula tenax TaxID=2528015 RepID=A0A5C6EYX5_9BACT|nr:peroxidase family protein [Rubripirellula tenax]TWU54358.1 Serine-aspartate repeat-containing protein I precursor [Rubripirellula tenax]